ncbi:MAG: RNA methyltransferase [Candidatus Falkowbacteria bacterium]|nr:MAG: RNA methyltransferase [Candidatus Falkowbacteria bacterium]
MTNINSLENKKIKELIKLQKASFRKKAGQFLIDGFREIDLAISSGVSIINIFYCPELAKKNLPAVFKRFDIIEVSVAVFKKISYKENADGFLALAAREIKNITDLKLSHNPLVIVLETVEKPGNLGAILRSAYAAGVEAVILNDAQTDIFNPNVIRSSEGHIFTNQIIAASVKETAKLFEKLGIKSFAAATSKSHIYTEADFSEPSAIILGSEADGLSKEWLKLADSKIKIPMKPGIDSLNVSVSAAIIIFEALRQRNISKKR